ncbi:MULTISPECIES: hypothetical protein [unclassified Pseudoclavibacter]|uniref:hypothetical protein n=1 Tax=unclassified Pseudoclavibacter TaxID=2615177 RepID=UPI001BA9BE73|nr:hypothetical protein [Pseudoclavibacter sp. Marseille-Q4354]MBS3177727.1 hypothetical protein [Pseudoclavibacter sp. Marseille-Q4354]
MSEPTDLQLVQAARDVLARTHPTNPVLIGVRTFALAELSQAEHDAHQGRGVRSSALVLARRLTKDERS